MLPETDFVKHAVLQVLSGEIHWTSQTKNTWGPVYTTAVASPTKDLTEHMPLTPCHCQDMLLSWYRQVYYFQMIMGQPVILTFSEKLL